MNYISIMLAEKRFRRWSYAKSVFKLFTSAVCYPSYLRCKALNVVFAPELSGINIGIQTFS